MSTWQNTSMSAQRLESDMLAPASEISVLLNVEYAAVSPELSLPDPSFRPLNVSATITLTLFPTAHTSRLAFRVPAKIFPSLLGVEVLSPLPTCGNKREICGCGMSSEEIEQEACAMECPATLQPLVVPLDMAYSPEDWHLVPMPCTVPANKAIQVSWRLHVTPGSYLQSDWYMVGNCSAELGGMGDSDCGEFGWKEHAVYVAMHELIPNTLAMGAEDAFWSISVTRPEGLQVIASAAPESSVSLPGTLTYIRGTCWTAHHPYI
jgi:hypothetical protein